MLRLKSTIIFAALFTASCGGDEPERAKIDAQVTETRMDDIDKIEGTINDDMINTNNDTASALLAKDDDGADKNASDDEE